MTSWPTRLAGTALLTALTLPGIAHAEDAGEIIVTGAPLAQPAGDAAYSIVTVNADRLASLASGRIEDALRDVAGLQQFRRTDARSANATSQGATLRGLGGNASSRALLVLDGVPQSDPFGGWITWPAYAPDRLGSVRVTRGGGSGSHGSGALSGLIELESVGPGTRSKVSVAGGSRDAIDASGLIAGSLGDGFGFIHAGYARGDGFVPIIASQRGAADIASTYEQAAVSARAVIPAGDQTELQASAMAFTDRRERGTILSGNGGDGADASIRLVHRGDWAWQALAYLQMRKFQSRFVAINAARDTVTQTVDQYNVPSTGVGSRFELRPPVGGGVELRIGGDWRRTTGETNELFTYVAGAPTRSREAGGRNDTLGLFAESSASLGDVTLTGGARIDRWSIGNGRLIERTISTGAFIRNELPADRTGWEPTGRLGASWDVTDQLKIRSAAYLGWRLPTLNELYRPFRVGADATAANAALKPERMRGVEAGLDWTPAEAVTIRATLFDNRLTDAIANVSLASGPGVFPGVGFVAAGGAFRQRQNLDAIRSRGVEVDATIRIAPWFANASYAYADAEVNADGAALPLNGLRPAQVPKHLASATLGWRGLSATVRYVSGQFEDDQNVRRLKDAVTLDASARLPVGHGLTLFARGENLTDTRVEAAISGAGVIERATPRTLWLGISYTPE